VNEKYLVVFNTQTRLYKKEGLKKLMWVCETHWRWVIQENSIKLDELRCPTYLILVHNEIV